MAGSPEEGKTTTLPPSAAAAAAAIFPSSANLLIVAGLSILLGGAGLPLPTTPLPCKLPTLGDPLDDIECVCVTNPAETNGLNAYGVSGKVCLAALSELGLSVENELSGLRTSSSPDGTVIGGR